MDKRLDNDQMILSAKTDINCLSVSKNKGQLASGIISFWGNAVNEDKQESISDLYEFFIV